MDKLANHIMSLVEKDKTKTIMFHKFPIKTICEIDVIISLEFIAENPCVRFLIDAQICIQDDDSSLFCKVLEKFEEEDGLSKITEETIMKYLQQIVDIIPTLKLDKFESVLTDEEIIFDEKIITLFKFDNTVLKYDICSVCHDLCGTITEECKHHLCVACVGKISENKHDCDFNGICDECGYKKCPLCRKDFYSIIKT
jgi:hypothetical protein